MRYLIASGLFIAFVVAFFANVDISCHADSPSGPAIAGTIRISGCR